jgi:hypothetical protein
MNTPPKNEIAGKRFYIAASYADKTSRESLTMLITLYGGSVVGHPLSADYYVAVNYNKPQVLGADVVNVDTIMSSWVPDAINERALRAITTKADPAPVSIHDKLDRIIQLLTTYNKL